MMRGARIGRIGMVIAMAGALAVGARMSRPLEAQLLQGASYTLAQAADGKRTYGERCASCHGANLDDGEFAPPLKGEAFQTSWGGKSADLLLEKLTTMPPAAAGSVSNDQRVLLLAYLLQANQVAAGARPLPADPAALQAMVFAGASGSGSGVTPGQALPPPLAKTNPLDAITPVTEAMLAAPAPGDWLTWRRAYDAHGFSPLTQITKANVGTLRTAWSWSLPPGPNEVTPLAHDGVLFVHSFGDKVQALDGATGDLLWQYSRWLPKDTAPGLKRAIAIWHDRLLVPTSDSHVVALDVRTGRVLWDSPVGDSPAYGLTGGPIVVKGNVIIGTTGRAPGGNLIVALNADTGKETWRFHTIPKPGEPGGDSWNGLPMEKRSGGSVWLPPSYDPALDLIYFGPAPTYDTAPLRTRAAGEASNDALYTNATVALRPETGKLVWFYSHLPNDQWDLDWAFERHVVRVSSNGTTKTLVVTSGKTAIFDALEADSGKYVYSMDLGLQNIVTAINPRTGVKTIDPQKVPGDGTAKFVCPNTIGGKNWLPSSYNPATKVLFVPLFEACGEYVPVAPGERGLLSTGVRHTVRPRPDSDGKYGRLQAINLETREVVWLARQRSPRSSGVLATAGGVVFAGSLDRVFAAYDDATGAELWRVRLNDLPSSAPISYTANGKQYVAAVVGGGGHHAANIAPLAPEIRNPPDRGASVWVFELPSPPR